ncbi:MAG: type II toxin-antitoxin system VapC family toxin [bacterium]
MTRYILDTGIVVGYLRQSGYAAFIEKEYNPFNAPNIAAISIVTVGELLSLAIQFHWGELKITRLRELLSHIPQIDIKSDAILEMYAQIDAFSQGKNLAKPLSQSARNMGENDVWIASTASVLNATLITTDKDFNHLDVVFLPVIYIDQSLKS